MVLSILSCMTRWNNYCVIISPCRVNKLNVDLKPFCTLYETDKFGTVSFRIE